MRKIVGMLSPSGATFNRKRWVSFDALVLIALVVCVACSSLTGDKVCTGVGYYAVRLEITDEFGEGLALGATATLTDGEYVEHDDNMNEDPRYIFAAEERGGRTYDVRVSKQYYVDGIVRGVRAPGGGCVTGHESTPTTIDVPVILHPESGAPQVRSVHLVPTRILLDRGRALSYAFRPYVDASWGVSRAVSWTISGDTAAVGFDAPTGTVTYRCLPTGGNLKIVARSLIDSTVSGSATIAVQGHPAATNDPPCS